jgi:hypothetical protein
LQSYFICGGELPFLQSSLLPFGGVELSLQLSLLPFGVVLLA